MAKSSLAPILRRVSWIRPWVAVATLLVLALLGYFLVLGVRYMSASEQVASLETQIGKLQPTRGKAIPNEQSLAAGRKTQEERLKELLERFNYTEMDDFLAILSATARESSIDLQRVSVGTIQTETRGTIQYKVQPMEVLVQGNVGDIYSFLSLLQQKVPNSRFSDVAVSSLQGRSLRRVVVLFHTSPKVIADK